MMKALGDMGAVVFFSTIVLLCCIWALVAVYKKAKAGDVTAGQEAVARVLILWVVWGVAQFGFALLLWNWVKFLFTPWV